MPPGIPRDAVKFVRCITKCHSPTQPSTPSPYSHSQSEPAYQNGEKPPESNNVRPPCNIPALGKFGGLRSPKDPAVAGSRVECTHSAIATAARPSTPKQRVLISAQYERKIDDIARDIDGIKTLLQRLNLPKEAPRQTRGFETPQSHHGRSSSPESCPIPGPPAEVPYWDHSAHVVDFVKGIVRNHDLSHAQPESSHVLSSLRSLAGALECSDMTHSWSRVDTQAKDAEATEMPPHTAVSDILRWAKSHENHKRIQWVVKTLPLSKFEEICCKVYSPVKGHTEAEFIITNSCLSYVFAEHAAIYGSASSGEYCRRCRAILSRAILRLPLYLPASMEMVAALALGALHLIEESRASRAWTLISYALNMCQMLGYHRQPPSGSADHLQPVKETLFWTVYSYENSVALRLGRSSGIRDSDITLRRRADEPLYLRGARIQRQVWERLYSPAGLSAPAHERGLVAQDLARQVRAILDEVYAEISAILPASGRGEDDDDDDDDEEEAPGPARDPETDPMRIVYLQGDLVCSLSVLVLILRAVPVPGAEPWQVSPECVAAARHTFQVHQQCINSLHECKDPLLVKKYINWAILQVPFVPFSILFARAVHLSDEEDLGHLETFAASLRPEPGPEQDAPTHPHRLYELLCQAARLHLDSPSTSTSAFATASSLAYDATGSFYANSASALSSDSASAASASVPAPFPDAQAQALPAADLSMAMMVDGGFDLSTWYYGNQQLMSFLDEDRMF